MEDSIVLVEFVGYVAIDTLLISAAIRTEPVGSHGSKVPCDGPKVASIRAVAPLRMLS